MLVRSWKKNTAAAAAFVGCAVLLAGCISGTPGTNRADEACAPLYSPGAASEATPAAWDTPPGEIAPVNPESVPATQVSTAAVANAQQVAVPGTILAAQLAIYDGASGALVYNSKQNPISGGDVFMQVPTETGVIPMSDVLRCAAVGQQVRAVLSQTDSQSFVQQLGIKPGANAVLLLTLTSIGGFKAEGAAKSLPSGFPAVTRNDAGVPGIVLPPVDPPHDLQSAISIQGAGRPVVANDTLVVRFTNIDWRSKTILNTNWGDQQGPQTITPVQGAKLPWREVINGVPIGSQVVIIEPTPDRRSANVLVLDILLAG